MATPSSQLITPADGDARSRLEAQLDAIDRHLEAAGTAILAARVEFAGHAAALLAGMSEPADS